MLILLRSPNVVPLFLPVIPLKFQYMYDFLVRLLRVSSKKPSIGLINKRLNIKQQIIS
jgi:hypothetical protein